MERLPRIPLIDGRFFGMGPAGRLIGFPGPLDGSSAIVAGGGMKI
jgi:hypothetical protein